MSAPPDVRNSVVPFQRVNTNDSSPAPRLLIYARTDWDADRLVHRLRSAGTEAKCAVLDGRTQPVQDRAIDVVVVRLGGEECDGLFFAADLAASAPWAEFIFWIDESAPSPSHGVARSLGLSRVLTTTQLMDWLPGALVPLAIIARARCSQLEAEAALPQIPETKARNARPPIALPEAERQFRETYLRSLLTATPNARRAAEKAGIPYTTLCSMMKKLGLSREERWGNT